MIQVCYPTAQLSDSKMLLNVVPFGRFDGNIFSIPLIPSAYALGKNNSIEALEVRFSIQLSLLFPCFLEPSC